MKTSEVLRAAGWFEGRAIDASADERALENHGYTLWPAADAFLREFSGLTFRFSRQERDDTVWFDVAKALAWADPASVEAYMARVGGQLIPVGYAYHDHMLLMLSENGHIIGAYDDYVADAGARPIEAIDNLLKQDLQEL